LGYARHRMDGFAWSKKKFCVAWDTNWMTKNGIAKDLLNLL
jgi:hypothetical protein